MGNVLAERDNIKPIHLRNPALMRELIRLIIKWAEQPRRGFIAGSLTPIKSIVDNILNEEMSISKREKK